MEIRRGEFDTLAHDIEANLRSLRHLIVGTTLASEAQVRAFLELQESLKTVELQSSALRHAILFDADPMSVEQLKQERSASSSPENELVDLEARLGMGKPREFPEEDPGGSATPAVPKRPVPVLAGGTARTFEEASEPPRNP